MIIKFITSLKKNIDVIIYITCKINKSDIESKLNIKLPKTLFNNFNGDYNDIKLQYFNDKIVVIGGLGKTHDCSNENIRRITSNCINKVPDLSNKNVCLFLMNTNKDNIEAQVISSILTLYDFNKYKTDGVSNLPANLYFYSKSKKYSADIKNYIIKASSANIVRDLINEPGNKLNPDTYIKEIQRISHKRNYSVQILNEPQLKKLGMGGITSVCQGSKYKPRLVILKYNPQPKYKKNIVLIGKGVTFDTGGINIKYGDFTDMKSDMTGSAIALGVMDAISRIGCKKNVICLLPIVENMIGENATRPGDVIKMYNKTTVEVTDTDAEGRLIMADAISYSSKFNPELIIDIATLTGAADNITSHKGSIIMGNNNRIINKLLSIGEKENEKLINLSLWNDFVEYTHSDIADYKNYNYSNHAGGALYAGAFLSNFLPPNISWIHIDLGGDIITNDNYYYKKGATGIGTKLLINYLLS
jgi:leucyl aminopeptidase